ncbi:glycosyltransferase family 2 protein [Salinisphaera hydrothermalis]|uniref:glycosyltransferase family 2 protein n=1 Tax=Salinisphaera hydrothermalis TaxID=563188 RepID=UPI0018DB81CD|nr:glycosyltransferase family A protein [Salinisphaera hydrothermalis]
MRVTAIISTYNRAGFLAEAIDSLLAQTRVPDELIIIDDASTDRTPDVLACYGASLQVIRHAENRGKPAGLNEVIPQAAGDYVWLFDDDDVALPDALARHIDFLDSHPDIDFTHSGAFHAPGRRPIWDRAGWRVNPVPQVAPEALLVETMMAMYSLMQGMLIPRNALVDIGLFDTTLDRCEDLDMLLRLAAAYRGGALAEPTYVYRDHDGIRGALGKQHAGQDRVAVMMAYRRRIFEAVYTRLALPTYVRHVGQVGDRDADCEVPAALLQRGCIMMRQGLLERAFADFAQAFAHPGFSGLDPVWRDTVLSRACDPEPWVFDAPLRTARTLVRLLEKHGQASLTRAFMRGAYWAFRRAMATRDRRTAAQSASFLAGLQKTRAVEAGRHKLRLIFP